MSKEAHYVFKQLKWKLCNCTFWMEPNGHSLHMLSWRKNCAYACVRTNSLPQLVWDWKALLLLLLLHVSALSHSHYNFKSPSQVDTTKFKHIMQAIYRN